jgi:hypothetical protein
VGIMSAHVLMIGEADDATASVLAS